MAYSKEALLEAKKQLALALHKTMEVERTFTAKENANRYKSQITLARRRIAAFQISVDLIDRELLACVSESAENT